MPTTAEAEPVHSQEPGAQPGPHIHEPAPAASRGAVVQAGVEAELGADPSTLPGGARVPGAVSGCCTAPARLQL